jgi:DNA (cytosine-5)-methyltransferase 1
MNKETTFRLGELFCGPGGLALGAKLAKVSTKGRSWNVEHAWANDIDPDTCRTYIRNITPERPDHVIAKPVQDLDLKKLPPIDAFAFGFPCNDYSIVGERKGVNGKFGPLYSYGINVLEHFRPKWFMAENVGGLANANSGRAFTRIMRDMENAGDGYTLTPHLYKFEEYGVPQKRHRIIIVGMSRKTGLAFKVPAPTTQDKHVTVEQALTVPPMKADVANNELTRQSQHVIERLMHIPAGKNVWFEGLPKKHRLNVRGARLSQIYRRLLPDAPAYTITGSGGGGTHVYHWSEPRALTNRERARLQTFPDWYVFEGSKESARKQIGMAVPPRGAKVIVEAVLKTFAGVAYPSIPQKWPLVIERPEDVLPLLELAV